MAGRALRKLKDHRLVRASVLRAGQLVRCLDRAPPGIYTLCYHRIATSHRRQFSAQIAHLKKFGAFIDADATVDQLAQGPVDRRFFLLSFDDGYADNVDVALPVLREHGVPAILFLVSDWLAAPPKRGRRTTDYMSPADVEAWLAAGLAIGSHSASHRRFSALSGAEITAELASSGERLARFGGRPVRDFACPWGVAGHDYDPQRDPALAGAAGYRTFFTTRRGHAVDNRDLMSMPRHVIEPEWGLYQLETLLGGRRFGTI